MNKFNIGDKVWIVLHSDNNPEFAKGRYSAVVRSVDDPEVIATLPAQHFKYAVIYGSIYVLWLDGQEIDILALEPQLELRTEEVHNAA